LVQGPPHAGSGCCLQVQVGQQLSWRLHHVLHAARPTQESALVLQLMKCTAARQACHQAAVGCRCKRWRAAAAGARGRSSPAAHTTGSARCRCADERNTVLQLAGARACREKCTGGVVAVCVSAVPLTCAHPSRAGRHTIEHQSHPSPSRRGAQPPAAAPALRNARSRRDSGASAWRKAPWIDTARALANSHPSLSV
jgi:hypothetical protein